MASTKLPRRLPHTRTPLLAPSSRPRPRPHPHPHPHPHPRRHLSLPPILRPAFWLSLLPRSPHTAATTPPPPRHWSSNPATPYIVLSLLIGSQAIQLLWLKQERAQRLRRADAKLGVLKEVIEAVRSGGPVDVEAVLGVGEGGEERAWGQVLREVAGEEALFLGKGERRGLRRAAEAEGRAGHGEAEAEAEAELEARIQVESLGGVKFY